MNKIEIYVGTINLGNGNISCREFPTRELAQLWLDRNGFHNAELTITPYMAPANYWGLPAC